jgi:hypothetical protein
LAASPGVRAWGKRDLSAPGLEVVNRALDYMLAQHEFDHRLPASQIVVGEDDALAWSDW